MWHSVGSGWSQREEGEGHSTETEKDLHGDSYLTTWVHAMASASYAKPFSYGILTLYTRGKGELERERGSKKETTHHFVFSTETAD